MCQNPIKYSSGWPENAITSTHYYVNCHLWYFFITVSYILTGNVILIPVCSWLASWKKIILQFSVIVEAIFTKGNEIGFVLVFSVSIFHRVCQFYFLSSTFLFTCVILLLTRFLCVFHSSSPLLLLITQVWLRPCLLAFVYWCPLFIHLLLMLLYWISPSSTSPVDLDIHPSTPILSLYIELQT